MAMTRGVFTRPAYDDLDPANRTRRPAQVGAEEGRPLGADGVQDQGDVVHVVLEALAAGATVGWAATEAVEQDEPREGGQLVQEPGHRRLLPQQPQMGGIAEQEDQVQLGVADPAPSTAATPPDPPEDLAGQRPCRLQP